MHWTQRMPEVWGLAIALSAFGYTGALERNMAAAMIATAVACMAARKLLVPNVELTGLRRSYGEGPVERRAGPQTENTDDKN